MAEIRNAQNVNNVSLGNNSQGFAGRHASKPSGANFDEHHKLKSDKGVAEERELEGFNTNR